jgi:hypothetical protein
MSSSDAGRNPTYWDRTSDDYQDRHAEFIGRFDLEVDELIEVRPPQGTESTYRTPAETEWARSWPLEEIWKVWKAR